MKTLLTKVSALYFSGFAGCISLFILLAGSAPAPDSVILGKWQEVSWEYEKMPDKNAPATGKTISNAVKKEITKDLVIHQAETWEFLPGGKLLLSDNEHMEKPLQWTLKSRGNILKLGQKDGAEYYNVQVLSDDEMILYFNTDLQAKGIAKMKFKKIDDTHYAQKIQ